MIFDDSPNKRSFRGHGGVGRGLDLGGWAEICERELASVVSVVSRGFQAPPVDDGTDNRYISKVSNTTLGPIN